MRGHYELVPAEIADKIAARRPAAVAFRATAEAGNSTDGDDPYAEYQVPDDLTW